MELLSSDKLLAEEFPIVERPPEASRCVLGLCFPVTFGAVNVLGFVPSNHRTVKITVYRIASTALTLLLAIAKFSLSADNNEAPSNYLDLACFLVALMCV